MCHIGSLRRKHELGIGSQFDLARKGPVVRDRYTANLGIILGRYGDHAGGRDRAVTPDDFDSILGERHLVETRLASTWLVTRRPDFAASHIAKKNEGTPTIASHILAPPCHGDVAPPAISGTRVGHHHAVSAIRQQMRARYGSMGRSKSPEHRRDEVADLGGRLDLFGPWTGD